ncbi:hypothetical protein ROZALSC1DRAFT_14544, partial [Rozella allomycis CSF55]
RAKMNQQRARRFRTAQEAHERTMKEKRENKNDQETNGLINKQEKFDSNCITPGTEFMYNMSERLKKYLSDKKKNDVNWKNVKVIYSGPEVPGEGEHKIMEYIRLNKAKKDHDVNTRHCLYGLDADLIMLGLLSHEPNFALLREQVDFGKEKERKDDEVLKNSRKFYLMHLCLVREYLNFEFEELKEVIKFEYSLERIIDDFILISMLVGNDFIPTLPNLQIIGATYFPFHLFLP